jgi:hypothetical protein
MNDWERELTKAFKELDEETMRVEMMIDELVKGGKFNQQQITGIIEEQFGKLEPKPDNDLPRHTRLDQPTPHGQRSRDSTTISGGHTTITVPGKYSYIHDAHLKTQEEIIRKATLEPMMAFLAEIRWELTNIRKILAKANKPKRKKK